MDYAFFNVCISKFLYLAFPQGTKIKVLINYMGQWSAINIKFTCNLCCCRMSFLLIFLAENNLFYKLNVLFCACRFRSSRTFFSSNVTSLIQQFLHAMYVPFISWMIINGSCSTILIFYSKIFNNYFLFV